MKLFISILIIAAIAAGLWFFFPRNAAEPEPVTGTDVTIQDFAYAPRNLVVAAGTTVTWTNRDSVKHNVVSDDGYPGLNGPLLAQGETFSFTFTEPGVYAYHCMPHPFMQATVTVQ